MDSPQASRLVISIFATQQLEIDARTALDTLPFFIELEMRGCNAAKLLPHVWRHIQVSDHCRDIYECLRDLTEMECTDCLPHPDFRSLFSD